MRYILLIIPALFFLSCSGQGAASPDEFTPDDRKQTSIRTTSSENAAGERNTKCVDSVFASYNLVDIQSIDPTIQVDLKYASADNFMKQRLYFSLEKLYLQKDVAERLSKSQHYLKSLHPDYSLLIYDGVRPVSVQQRMWDALDTIPVSQRSKFVSNPKNHSIHNYGAAIDLTITDENGTPLDMGAGYDDIRKIAYPSMEEYFLKTGELTPRQVENRKLLRKVMKNQGFINIPSEWWHFNAYSRNEVKRRYQVVMEEPVCD